jgi:hypothetical protein
MAFQRRLRTTPLWWRVHALYYNFARIHKTLRITPAMAAGLSDHVWSVEEVVLLAEYERVAIMEKKCKCGRVWQLDDQKFSVRDPGAIIYRSGPSFH